MDKTKWAAEGKEMEVLLGGRRRRNHRYKVRDRWGPTVRRTEDVHEGEDWDKERTTESQRHQDTFNLEIQKEKVLLND